MNNMRAYVSILNQCHQEGLLDIEEVERFWIERVKLFFAGKPFKLRVDPSQGLKMVVRLVLAQAKERQKESTGTNFAGAVMQHLVGAKLECVLPEIKLEHHSFSTSDEQTSRAGDFLVGDTAIHVTTAPNDGMLSRCRENIEVGLRPVVITTQKGIAAVDQLAENIGLSNRVDVFEIEQFIALNIYELGKFLASGQRNAVNDIIAKYNEIVETVETDPSLGIKKV